MVLKKKTVTLKKIDTEPNLPALYIINQQYILDWILLQHSFFYWVDLEKKNNNA